MNLKPIRPVVLALGFATLGLFSTFPVQTTAQNDERDRRAVPVQLGTEPEQRTQNLSKLAQFDVMGIDWASGQAIISVNQAEFETLMDLGLNPSFDGPPMARQSAQGYLTPEAMSARLQEFTRQYPNLARVKSLGTTHKGRSILALEISSNLDDPMRPTLLLNSMHHSRELMSAEVAVHAASLLLSDYSRDPEVKGWLDNYRIVLVPQVNPDGNAFVHQGRRM